MYFFSNKFNVFLLLRETTNFYSVTKKSEMQPCKCDSRKRPLKTQGINRPEDYKNATYLKFND